MADRRWARAFRTRTGECHDQVRDVSKLRWRIRVTYSTHLGEVIVTRMPEDQSGVRGVRRHHLLVRCSHWLNALLGSRCPRLQKSVMTMIFNLDATKEKDMKLSQAYRIALIGIAGFLLTTVCQRGAVAQTKSPQGVRNIVMVHGAWADGSSWSRVIPLLQAKGLHVVAVQNPLTSLADDVAATKRAIASQDGPVLLVGHSYGGAVITEAGNDPEVERLVYIAAFAPDQGESVSTLIQDPPPGAPVPPILPPQEGFLFLD